MVWYPEAPAARARRAALDVGAVLWLILWVRIGLRVRELFDNLAAPGRSVEDAGSSISDIASSASDRVGGLPVVGDDVADLFSSLGDGGAHLSAAGVAQQDVVHDLALLLGALVALLPILWLASRYLPGRLRWVRDASAAVDLRDAPEGLRLFALRAIVTMPLPELRSVSADPAGDYDAGRYEALAAAELHRLGLLARDPLPQG